MSIQSPILTDFTAGELSPRMSGRVDLAVYARGCLTLENWVPFSQGGVTTRPGSKYLGTTKNNVEAKLQPWTLSDGTSLQMEFTPQVLRLWSVADGTLLESAPGVTLELATPYVTSEHCRDLRCAQDGDNMFVSHDRYPLLIVKWTGKTAMRLDDLAELPGALSEGTAFSYDGTYLAFASTSPTLTIYKRSGDTFAKLADPATMPDSSTNGVAFSFDGTYLAAVGVQTSRITIYKRAGDVFTKLTDPVIVPTGTGQGVAFSYDGTYLAVAHGTTPFITIYKRSGDTFTKLADPLTLPPAIAYEVSFSRDGTYLAVAHTTTPFVTIYKRSGDVFTKLTDPVTLPTGGGKGVAFSFDGTYLAVAHTTAPCLTIYKRSGDTFTKLPDPAALPLYEAKAVSFSFDGLYLAVTELATPFIKIYKRSGDTFTLQVAPASLPTAEVRALAFSYDGLFLSAPQVAAPWIVLYKTDLNGFTIAEAVIVSNPGLAPFGSPDNYPAGVACFGQRLWAGPTRAKPQNLWCTRPFIYTEARGVPWAGSTVYNLGDIVINDTGRLYLCVVAGTSAASGGPTGVTATIVDGTVTWDYWCSSGSLDFTFYERRKQIITEMVPYLDWVDPAVPETREVVTYRDVVTDDAAAQLNIYSDRSDRIQTLISGKTLLVGTQYSEYMVPADFTALLPRIDLWTRHGSHPVQGSIMGDAVFFLQKLGTRLREFPNALGVEGDASRDLTFLAEHILGTGGAVDMDFATVPEPMIYCVRADGQLAVLLYNRPVGTQAWHRYVTSGGFYKSIAVSLGASGDSVYACVLRDDQYCIEVFNAIGDAAAIPLDGWVDVPTAGATVTGLDRFDGTTATIWNVTESAVYTAAVAAGSMTVPALCVGDHLVVGKLITCVGQTMRVTTDGPYGTGQARIRKIGKVTARLYASYAFKFGRLNTAAALESFALPSAAPFTGDVDCAFQGDWDRDTWVYFVQDQPYHSTILALVPQVET